MKEDTSSTFYAANLLMEVTENVAEGGTVEEAVNAPSESTTDTSDYIPDHIPKVNQETLDQLSKGFLSHFVSDAQKARTRLNELTQNQRILLETVQHENTKFSENEHMRRLTETMNKAKQYHTKLLEIKKEMAALHEKSAKIKKRALKLQQQKQKEALQREQQKEKELERERRLMAKPAKRE